MKILLVVSNFIPEIGSASHLYYDLAKAFIKRGHEIHILTSYPREFNLNNEDKDKTFPLYELIDGIHVHRCKHTAQRDNVILRGFEHFMLPKYYFNTYKKINIKFDSCLIYIPPLPLYRLALRIKKYSNTPSILNFQDFHPQELIDVGVMRNPIWVKIMEYIEKQAYKNADYITVLSKKGVKYVIDKGGDSSRISHIYNGVLIENFDKEKIKKNFKIKQGIQNKKLITYAGILSPYQGLDKILDAAKMLRDENDLLFYIVGEGSEKKHLENRIFNENIKNVKILPFQKRKEYFNIINSSDIVFVTLDERMKAPCLPGKIKDLLALKKPIIASVSKETETADFIKDSGAGILTEPKKIDDLYLNINLLKNNEKLKNNLGNKGFSYLKKNMDLEKNVEKYEKIISKIV